MSSILLTSTMRAIVRHHDKAVVVQFNTRNDALDDGFLLFLGIVFYMRKLIHGGNDVALVLRDGGQERDYHHAHRLVPKFSVVDIKSIDFVLSALPDRYRNAKIDTTKHTLGTWWFGHRQSRE